MHNEGIVEWADVTPVICDACRRTAVVEYQVCVEGVKALDTGA
jgi:hypothetical protein